MEELRDGISLYLQQESNVRIEVEGADGHNYALRLRLATPPDALWPAIIGDVLHNVRSALDSLTWNIVVGHLPRPMTLREERSVLFPIHSSNTSFERAHWAPQDLPRSVRDVFRSLQPFADLETLGLTDAETVAAMENHPLTRLQRWSNIDKHRGLHPTVCAPDLVYVGLQEGQASEWVPVDPWPWTDGSIIARVRITGVPSERPPEFGNQLAMALEEDASPLRVPPVVDRLNGLLGQADWAVHTLRPYLN